MLAQCHGCPARWRRRRAHAPQSRLMGSYFTASIERCNVAQERRSLADKLISGAAGAFAVRAQPDLCAHLIECARTSGARQATGRLRARDKSNHGPACSARASCKAPDDLGRASWECEKGLVMLCGCSNEEK